jgi:hypothetical protein
MVILLSAGYIHRCFDVCADRRSGSGASSLRKFDCTSAPRKLCFGEAGSTPAEFACASGQGPRQHGAENGSVEQ